MENSHPVILIHGLWNTAYSMEWLASFLEKKGFSVINYQFSPNDGSVFLHTLAQSLKDFIEEKGITKCDIVGYSMGGMIAQLYIQEYEGYKKVKKCVTISSPHKGTLDAYFLFGKGSRELQPSSDFIKKLKSQSTERKAVQWLSIRTPLDLMVIPSTSSRIDFGDNKIAFVPFHHLMITNKKVAEYVYRFLKE